METSNLEGWDKDVRYFKISNCDDSSDKDSDSDSETETETENESETLKIRKNIRKFYSTKISSQNKIYIYSIKNVCRQRNYHARRLGTRVAISQRYRRWVFLCRRLVLG